MGNLFKVITSPQQTFERMREEKGAGWVAVMITLMVLGGVAMWLKVPEVIAYTDVALHHTPSIDEDPESFMILTTMIIAVASAILAPVLVMFLDGLLLLLVNLFVRGEAKYMQLGKVALYASVPTVIGGLITGIITRLTGSTLPDEFALNAGAFFSDKHGWGFALASQLLDPFEIWGLVLLVIGTAVMTRRERSKVALWILIGWGVLKVISTISIAIQK